MAMTSKAPYQTATEQLAQRDAVLAPVIARSGPCTIRPHGNYYQALVQSIIGQQLSVKAADTIIKRFRRLFGSSFPEPRAILQKSVEELRSAGLSNQKANYIRDLAQHVVDGRVTFGHLDSLSNEKIIAELTAVKGIGEWTVHMFLIFCMGRLDVLAHGDLGIRSAVKNRYGFDHLPTPQEVRTVAEQHHWHPYETVACWHLWQSLDNAPATAQ